MEVAWILHDTTAAEVTYVEPLYTGNSYNVSK